MSPGWVSCGRLCGFIPCFIDNESSGAIFGLRKMAVESVLPIDWMGQEPSGRRPASPGQESREETINAVQVREEMAGGRPHSGVRNVEAFYWNWGRYSVSSFAWSKFNYCNFFFFVSQD